jgi:hypothetical protein
MRMPRIFQFLKQVWLRFLAFGLLALCFTTQASAVITVTTGYTGVRTITMRVGTASPGVINVVQFNVANTPTGNSQAFAASVNGNGTPINASSGGVFINMNMKIPAPNVPQFYRLSVTSPANLTCVVGSGCGAATIPFNSISWTMSVAPSGVNAPFDFQNGTFAGGTTQSLSTIALTAPPDDMFNGTADFSGTMNFIYTNSTPYPAGSYTGRVVYTVTLL